MKPLLGCAVAFLIAAPAISSAAPTANGSAAVKVAYGDLNLSSPGDAAVLLQRIDNAATRACGASRDSLSEYRWAVRRSACHESGMERAVSALDAPTVTSLYNSADRSPALAD